jgi:hypothetical protein
MKEILLRDPTRRPPDWINALQPGEFAVFLVDVRAGVAVDSQGRLLSKGSRRTCLVFDDFSQARSWCQERAAAVENLRCRIYDYRGNAEPPVLEIVNPKFAGRLGSPRSAKRKMIGGVALIVSSIPLFFWDYYRDLRFFPTIMGVNLILIGLRLLHWGYGELELLREQEQRLAALER